MMPLQGSERECHCPSIRCQKPNSHKRKQRKLPGEGSTVHVNVSSIDGNEDIAGAGKWAEEEPEGSKGACLV